MSLETGSRLGAHEILGLLGAGGMGEVYRARDTKLNRDVAIKVLPDPYAGDPERVARFHREAQAVAALNHPNIAAIYELAESGLTKFLVLELVAGDTLADRTRRGPVPVEEALAIAKQILDALETAHEKGICHRDLKPANVKLTPEGAVKVLDFGLAKFLEAAVAPAGVANLTHSPTLSLAGTFPGVILGTAGYMSPEQAKGFEADERSDIFSFGCIFYELLTGRQAFDGDTASEILASVIKTPVDFAALPPNLNPRLVEILKRCLEKNPRKRWHSAADVRLELESLADRATAVDAPRAVARAVARPPFWKRAIPVAAAALLASGVAGYGAWKLKPEPVSPVVRFPLMLPEHQLFTNTGRRIVALSPDGTALVYIANQRLYLRAMSALDSREVAGTSFVAGGITNPTFSPDGQSIVFANSNERALKRVSVSGGAPVTLCAADQPYGVSWDGSGIVWAEPGRGILRVSANGGTPEVLVPVGTDETIAAPQMLPGGNAVLFSTKKATDIWDKGRVVVQTLRTGGRKTLVEGGADGHYVSTGHLVYAVSGVLLAVPFDLSRLAISGGPVPVVEGVQRAGIIASQTGLAQFSTSATGTLAYIPGPAKAAGAERELDLAIFDRNGQMRPFKLPPATYRAPRASPDGKTVAFEREEVSGAADVWLYEVSGTTAMRRLTFGGNNHAPVWSPDGRWIAFQSDREGALAVFRQRADGSGTAERLTTPSNGESHTPQSWSPDGAHLLITAQKGAQYTLAIFTPSDRSVVPFGNVRSTQPTEASFSPDGQWILYQSADEGPRQILVQPFPATGAKYLVPAGPAATAGAGHPFWNRNGREIVMNAAPTVSYAVTFTAKPQVAFGQPVDFPRAGRTEPNPASERRAADAMPDGEHIVGVTVPGAPGMTGAVTPQVDVVLNWFEELKQKVPVK